MTVLTSTTSIQTGPASNPRIVEIQRVPWSILGPQFIVKWGRPRGKDKPEHVEVLGQTGSGKSYWMATVLVQRQIAKKSHIVYIATKADDDTIPTIGWPIVEKYPPQDQRTTACVFWIPSTGLDVAGQRLQAKKIYDLLVQLWHPEANIVVVFDEVAYVCNDINFPPDIPNRAAVEKYLREGRALGITVMAATQRPQGVPRQIHSEVGWTVCFAPKDEEDAERMAEVLGGKRTYKPILESLDREKFEFLIVHGLTRKMYISWVDHPIPEPPGKNAR